MSARPARRCRLPSASAANGASQMTYCGERTLPERDEREHAGQRRDEQPVGIGRRAAAATASDQDGEHEQRADRLRRRPPARRRARWT